MKKITIKVKRNSKRWPTAIDLFCGCGGVTEGLKKGRFRVIAAVDNDPIATKTYRRNHPGVHLYNQDIKVVDPNRIRKEHLKDQNLDILIACAPCQPFSSQNRKSRDDTRTDLLLSVVRFAKILCPTIIFFENVPGLGSPKFSSLLAKLNKRLIRIGYTINGPNEIDAADYGVPQRRRRFILIATRNQALVSIPSPITPEGKRVTVRKVMGRFKPLEPGEKHPRDLLHFARNHREIALRRLKHIPQNGGSRHNLPEFLELKCHKGHKGHPDVYGRMEWDNIAPTLTTGCTDITRGRFAHPTDCRAITLREAARLQTFPDHYQFLGSSKDIANQIGNAVPVRLMETLCSTFRTALRS